MLELLVVIWVLCLVVSYHYFHSLFLDLKMGWSRANRIACGLLCIAGPAAMVCALMVDATRPLVC